MDKIKVLLIDDYPILREGIRLILERYPDIIVVGEAEYGAEAIEKVGQLNPDVVLMDVVMRRMNGLQATRIIRQLYPHVQILIITVHEDEEYITRILQAGASGYLLKRAAAYQMILAIRALHRGEPFLDPSIAGTVIRTIARRREGIRQENAEKDLTQREIEIVTLIANGHTNHEIADILNISVKTVDTHRSNISAKLDIHNRVDLAKYAIRKGYVSLKD